MKQRALTPKDWMRVFMADWSRRHAGKAWISRFLVCISVLLITTFGWAANTALISAACWGETIPVITAWICSTCPWLEAEKVCRRFD